MIDEKTLADLKAAHGAVFTFEHDGQTFVLRKPKRAEYRRFRAMIHDEDRRPDAAEQLARDCVVYPEAAALNAIFEDLPALADTLGGQAVKLAGGGKADDAKKA